MKCCCSSRWLGLGTLVLFGASLLTNLPGGHAGPDKKDSPKPGTNHDWPMLGGNPQRNAVNLVEKNPPTDWKVAKQPKDAKNVKWVAQLGSRAYGGPVIAGGKVFVGTNNAKPRNPAVKGPKAIVMCFRESDGQFLWQAVHDMPPKNIVISALYDGLCSSPVVEGDRLYYVTPACEVICASTDSGKAHWRLDMMKKLKVFPCYLANCSPLIVGDLLFVVTGNGVVAEAERQLPSPKAPSFLAINKKDGQVVWKDNSPGEKIIEGQYSSPAAAQVNGKMQVVFPGGDGWLYGFEATKGKLLWKFNCNPKKAEKESDGHPLRNYIVATPVIADQKVYVGVGVAPDSHVGPGIGHLWCVDMTKSGDVSPVNDNFDARAPENKNSALVWHFGGLIKPPPKEIGARKIRFGPTINNCVIHEGLVYAVEEAGFIYCLDAATGKLYWQHDFKTDIWGSPCCVDGKVYLGSNDGDVHILAHGKEKKILKQIEVGEAIKTTPVVANGVLYIQTDVKLYAIASK
jgi:outer membrane protein assembly factor BamB